MADTVFQSKYDEFVEDLLGALPEYNVQINNAKALDGTTRLSLFQGNVKVDMGTEYNKNPGTVLPGVEISDTVWKTLSENTQKAIWEHLRILSMCYFMENGPGSKPDWMNDAMDDMKKNLEGTYFQNIIKKFMSFLKPGDDKTDNKTDDKTDDKTENKGIPGFEKIFENGFPKIPEKFLKGHMAKLAQEIVKDITPEDLGISAEMVDECEKNPSRAFDILFKVFGNNPDILQKTVQKIGKRLQQKIMSGSIKPQEIAREAEELMKEFADNSSFVDMMDGIKKAFGFEDMDIARKAGKEGSARLSIVKERLKKKVSEKEAKKVANDMSVSSKAVADADKAMNSLLNEEAKKKPKKTMTGKGKK